MSATTAHSIPHAAFLMIAAILCSTSFQRAGIYKNESSLWADSAGKSSKARPHNNLGRAYEEEGKNGAAAIEYRYVVNIMPGYAPGHSNLAGVYMKQGMWDDAENELNLAIAYGPPFEDLRRRLGFVYLRKGLPDKALAEFEKARALIPNHPDARLNAAGIYTQEGFSYTDKGDFPRALLLHKVASSIDPSYANAHYGLALDYEAMGQKEHALRHWQEYLMLAPPDEPFREDAMKHIKGLE